MNRKQRGELIRSKILSDVGSHPQDIVNHIARKFSITPQAVHAHIQKLERENWLRTTGSKRGKKYYLGTNRLYKTLFKFSESIAEDKIWRDEYSHLFEGVTKNVKNICHYGFTEMVNNAIDHSNGTEVSIAVGLNQKEIHIFIGDDGEGIFQRIRKLCGYEDERQAMFELSKGKLTTDPKRHTGEGIFFTSRAFDYFLIESKGLQFSHQEIRETDKFEESGIRAAKIGTSVLMVIDRNSQRELEDIFDQFSSGPEEFRFNKTVVPIKLLQYGTENLISRSQAKRVMARIQQFEKVVFDFTDIENIGQAFADEIFRVYSIAHPGIDILAINMNEPVTKMVNRAFAAKKEYLN